jgi:MFS family permease
VLLLSAWAGAITDRVDEKRAVIAVQVLLGAQATVLTAVVVTDTVEVWMLYALALVHGVGQAFDTPARQALVGRIVGNHDLHNALSLNGALTVGARVVGPAVAGLLIETVGISACFTINAISYGVVALAVLSIRTSPRPAAAASAAKAKVVDGVLLVWRSPELRNVLLLALVNGLVMVNFTVGLPVLVRQEHGNRAGLFGFLLAIHGLGALGGAALSAARHVPTKRLMHGCQVALAVSLALMASTAAVWVLVPAIAIAGGTGLTLGITLNSSLQTGAPQEFRGRVIGLYFLVVFGSNVLGGPVIGAVAETWSAGAAFASSAALVALAAAAVAGAWRGRLDEPVVAPTQTSL